MPSSIRVERNVPMTARDGVTLRSDVFRPDDNGKYPAILIRTPYNKLFGASSDLMQAVDAAFREYAVVIQDCRLRLDITSSNFPRFDRNMNTDNPIGEDAFGMPAVQTVLHERCYASYIDLPVIGQSCGS